jgi:hypothetical protein
MRRTLLLASGLAAAAATASPREARAGIFFGAEADAGQGIGFPMGAKPGVGFLGTLGYRIAVVGPLFLQPEAQGGYMVFPVEAADATHVARVLGGARLGLAGLAGSTSLAGIFQPSIFGHTGVGWLSADANGIAADAGLALAFRLVPFFTFGAQASYNVVTIPSRWRAASPPATPRSGGSPRPASRSSRRRSASTSRRRRSAIPTSRCASGGPWRRRRSGCRRPAIW